LRKYDGGFLFIFNAGNEPEGGPRCKQVRLYASRRDYYRRVMSGIALVQLSPIHVNKA
jgi:hypothetical protein